MDSVDKSAFDIYVFSRNILARLDAVYSTKLKCAQYHIVTLTHDIHLKKVNLRIFQIKKSCLLFLQLHVTKVDCQNI